MNLPLAGWTWGEVFVSTWTWVVPSILIAVIALVMTWRREGPRP